MIDLVVNVGCFLRSRFANATYFFARLTARRCFASLPLRTNRASRAATSPYLSPREHLVLVLDQPPDAPELVTEELVADRPGEGRCRGRDGDLHGPEGLGECVVILGSDRRGPGLQRPAPAGGLLRSHWTALLPWEHRG